MTRIGMPPIAALTFVSMTLGLLAFPGHGQAETVAMVNARLIDGSGSEPIENGTLVIEGEKIAAAGPAASVTIPKHARVLDMKGKTVLPGLVSDHSHVGFVDGTTAGPSNYTAANVERQLRQFQRYGVTTVTSLGLNRPQFEEFRAQAHAGNMNGADLFGADRGMGVFHGVPTLDLPADQVERASTPEEARAAIRDMATRQPDLIKIWVDDNRGQLQAKMSQATYTAAIDEAHKLGLRVAAHVYYLEDAKKLVAAGVDMLAHGVRDQFVDPELIAAMKKNGTGYIPTLQLNESFYIYAEGPSWMQTPFFQASLQPELAKQFADPAWRRKTLNSPKGIEMEKEALAINQRNLKLLSDGRVRLGFGTDSGANPLRIPGFAEHRELELMVEAGLTPLDALTVATGGAAELLELTDRGKLKPGMRADLLVVEGNPAQSIRDLHQIDSVWQRGRKVSGPIAH